MVTYQEAVQRIVKTRTMSRMELVKEEQLIREIVDKHPFSCVSQMIAQKVAKLMIQLMNRDIMAAEALMYGIFILGIMVANEMRNGEPELGQKEKVQ